MAKHSFRHHRPHVLKRRDFNRLSLGLLGLGLASCNRALSPASTPSGGGSDNTLKVWWQEGFYPEETDALDKIIASWEAESGVAVELTAIPQKDILSEIERALATDTLPDVCYAGVGDITIFPRLAWNGQLLAVDDVLEPLKALYDPTVLEGVSYQNTVAGDRKYYAVPIMQSAIHIHYWQDMLSEIGVSREDIPSDWDEFWQFWVEIQAPLRQAKQSDIYSVGMPMSLSLDTYNNFEQFLEAYDVEILDAEGKLQIEKPAVREGLISAIKDYARFHRQGVIPPDAADWDNIGNNATLLSRTSLMTVNHTLSAPGSQRQSEDIYFKQLSTVPWPNKPNGQPMRHVVELKQVVIFKDTAQPDVAKDFLRYLAQPENLQAYTQGAQARYQPVMPQLLDDPFWQNSADVHVSAALQQLKNTRPAYQVLNPAYGEVAAQNVWGTLMRQIAVDNLSVEKAVDQAIDTLQTIFSAW